MVNLNKYFAKENRKLYFLITLILSVFLFVYFGTKKDIWFCDEIFTYETVNAIGKSKVLAPPQTWITGQDVAQYLAADQFELNFKDIADHLYQDHVPLYFWLFRLVSLIFLNSCSKWIGLSINLVFYLILIGVAWHLLRKYSKRDLLATLGALILATNLVVLSQATTLRMYLMFSTIILLYICFMGRIINHPPIVFKDWILLFFLAVTGMLTHYYIWIFFGIFSVIAVIDWFLNKKWSTALYYIGTMLFGLAMVTILFPQWIDNVFVYKGKSSMDNLITLENIGSEIQYAFRNLFKFGFKMKYAMAGIVISFIILVFFFWFEEEKHLRKFILYGSLTCVVYACFVSHTQPSIEARYISPVCVIMLFLLLLCVQSIMIHIFINKQWFRFGALIIYFSILIINLYTSMSDSGKNIAYLTNRPISEKETIESYSDIPWILYSDSFDNLAVYCSFYDFTIPERLMRMESNTTMTSDPILRSTDAILVYINEEKNTVLDAVEDIKKVSNHKSLTYEKVMKGIYMTAYLVHLN